MTRLATAQLHSGFGNRLFQMAAAAWYAKRFNRQLVFIDDYMGHTVHDAATPEFLFKVLQSVPRLKSVPSGSSVHSITYRSLQQDSDADVAVLDGYFQSPEYAEALRPHAQAYLAGLVDRRTTAWIHVRCGDYMRLTSLFNTFSMEGFRSYYEQALRAVPGPYELISDDPAKATQFLGQLLSPEAVSVLPRLSLEDTFAHFITSSGAIVCNSTFSWWGARMLTWVRPEALVASPSPWCRVTVFQKTLGLVWRSFEPPELARKPDASQWTLVNFKTNTGLSTAEWTLLATCATVVMLVVALLSRRRKRSLQPRLLEGAQ